MSEYNFKYRPQKISGLDLTSVRESLAQVLKSEKIPHAFLFTGPRGTGKTSAARIVAKAINCKKRWEVTRLPARQGSEKPFGSEPQGRRLEKEMGSETRSPEPCNKCEQCISITKGSNLDVLEIDAASNRGIDDIRDLREKVKLAPSSASYKVYIIDEVHMLTNEAFNALLKTLEEPPEHVVFILCTTEPEKLPDTIISRCLRINFKKAKQDEVVEKLKKVVEEEKLKVESSALSEIAKGAQGSFRDALKILEQASFVGGEITKKKVMEILGQTTGSAPEKLLESLFMKDAKSALGEIDGLVESGGNLRVYTTQVLEMLRGVLLAKLGVGNDILEADLEKMVKSQKTEDILAMIEALTRASIELKEAIIPQLPLELAVVEWCEDGEEIKENKEVKEDNGGKREKDQKEKTQTSSFDSSDPLDSPSIPNPLGSPNTPSPLSLDDIKCRWQELLLSVRPKNFSIEAFLRAARPIDVNDKMITIEVFYGFHKDKLESDKCRRVVEEVASEIFGLPLNIRCVLGEKPRLIREAEAPKFKEDVMIENEDIFNVAEKIFQAAGKEDGKIN
ncbi:MAG: DNA polymerase III subunit gamma/tau [bacterium]|nr:DNA polymerase III subunit gamma/tau [bacterium]